MKNAISTSGARWGENLSLKQIFSSLREAGYDVIDFWMNLFCMGEDAPLLRDDWRAWAQETAQLARAYGLRVGQAHAHWNHPCQIEEDFTFHPPLKKTLRCFEACKLMDCRHLVFHPIQRWHRMPEEGMRQKILDINAQWFASMLPEAEKYGVEIDIENLFDHKHVQQPGDPLFPFSTADDILYVVEKINHPLVRVCLDTGHAFINAQDVPAMIRRYGARLGALHLNDNYGKIGPIYEDLHLFPGYGRIPWPEVFAALKEIDYQGTLNMEPTGEMKHLPREMCVIQRRAAREMLEAMSARYGA